MLESGLTLVEIETICRQAATGQPATAVAEFRPTANQIYFFTLVWLLKQKIRFWDIYNRLEGQIAGELPDRVRQVAGHLDDWGETVADLKRREAKAWELLRIQMEKALSYYRCRSQDLKADALQEALLKILMLLEKMVEGRQLDETEDVTALVVNNRAALSNIYDFGSPFYAFAKRLARNEFVTHLRKENRQPIYPGDWEDIEFVLLAAPPPLPPDEGNPAFDAQLWQLRLDLARLLEFIQHALTPKPRQVVCQTLAAQPHFWRLLTLAGLTAPPDFPLPSKFRLDAEIAAVLKMDENSLRANRSQAKKRLRELDPLLELLLDRLFTRRGGLKKDKDEPIKI